MQNNIITKFCIALITNVFFISIALSQAPQAIPYQAAARDNLGVILTNKTIGLRFSVHDATTSGTVVYQETQNATTNILGMFIVNIGQGVPVTGSFSAINWNAGAKFMQVELDTTATGSNYTDMGTQQMMSVPYALSSGDGVPVGTVVAFMGTTAPTGWLLCNGTAISRTNYALLFSLIGSSSGAGDGSTTFNLPDMRGRFLRAVDGGSGNDPDAGSRTANFVGGNIGNNVGSVQLDEFISHAHRPFAIPAQSIGANAIGGAYTQALYGGTISLDNAPSTGLQGGAETRPKNIYVNYIIKY